MGAVRLRRSGRSTTISGPLRARWLPDQERQQVPARPVGPVRVLDHQDHWRVLGQVLDVALSTFLEQPGPGLGRIAAGIGLAELSGDSRASPRRWSGPAASRPPRPRPVSSARRAQRGGRERGEQSLSPSVPSSRQPPVSTRAPADAAVRPNSPTSLDFPTPASPPRSTADGPPWRTLAKAASRAAICSSRPTRTGLEARPLISGVSVPRGSDIPERSLAADEAVMATSGGVMGGGRLARLAGRLVVG